MWKVTLRLLAAATLLWSNVAAAENDAVPATAPDLILVDGTIFTGNPAQPHAAALAIHGERIVAVGENAAVQALADAHTRQINLGGRTVIPGLNDAHAHLGIWPKETVWLHTKGYDPGWEEMRTVIAAAAAKSAPGTFLRGTFGGAILYDPKIDGKAIDQVAPDHPVILSTFDAHADILNAAALVRLGIGEDVADPWGGRFERGADGHLTGMVREYAAFGVVSRRFGALTSDEDALATLGEQLD